MSLSYNAEIEMFIGYTYMQRVGIGYIRSAMMVWKKLREEVSVMSDYKFEPGTNG
jgi:hypothetical protein